MGKFTIGGSHLGNMEDIPLRTMAALKTYDYIISEYPELLEYELNQINVKPIGKFIRYSGEALKKFDYQKIVDYVNDGKKVLFLVDRGMPGFADPGSILVNRLTEQNIDIEIIPGPGIVQTAIAISGLNYESNNFFAMGTFTNTYDKIKKDLIMLKDFDSYIVIVDRPIRTKEILEIMLSTFNENRPVSLCIDLSLPTQKIITGDYQSLINLLSSVQISGFVSIVSTGSDYKRFIV